jgi:hypothetical protein
VGAPSSASRPSRRARSRRTRKPPRAYSRHRPQGPMTFGAINPRQRAGAGLNPYSFGVSDRCAQTAPLAPLPHAQKLPHISISSIHHALMNIRAQSSIPDPVRVVAHVLICGLGEQSLRSTTDVHTHTPAWTSELSADDSRAHCDGHSQRGRDAWQRGRPGDNAAKRVQRGFPVGVCVRRGGAGSGWARERAQGAPAR